MANNGYEERLSRMRRAMEREQLDALILRLPENVLLLSGWWPMIGASVLVFPREGEAVCIVPDCYAHEASPCLWEARAVFYRFGVLDAPPAAQAIAKELTRAAADKGWKHIGYEGDFPVSAPSWNSAEVQVPTERTREFYASCIPDAHFQDAAQLLQIERRRKTAFEAVRLRLASKISCIGLQAFQDAVDIGRTGVELAALVEHAIMTKGTGLEGASRVRAYAQVATGPKECAAGYRPNEISTSYALKNGDLAMLELGVVVDGYWADRTRVRAAGTPSDEQSKVYELIRRAKAAAIAALRPGRTGAEIDAASRTIIRDAGYGDAFPHITGHGLGFGYHEPGPLLSPASNDILESGMLTSVEPGVYFEPMGGIRIEDDVLVTQTGAEILGAFPEQLS
jgi:Xaa-Pro aminopeptidase